MKQTQYYQVKTSISRTVHGRHSFPCFQACHRKVGPSTEIHGSDDKSRQPNRMNHIHQIPKQKRQRINYESYGFSSRREDLSITLSSFCVFIRSRPWRLPGHLLQKTSFQLLTTLSVWNHQFLYKASTGYSIWKSCFHQKQRSSQHSKLFILLHLKTVTPSYFWRKAVWQGNGLLSQVCFSLFLGKTLEIRSSSTSWKMYFFT